MALKNPDTWAPTHRRRLALSRWDGEGGASPSRSTAEPTETTAAHEAKDTAAPHAVAAPPQPQAATPNPPAPRAPHDGTTDR